MVCLVHSLYGYLILLFRGKFKLADESMKKVTQTKTGTSHLPHKLFVHYIIEIIRKIFIILLKQPQCPLVGPLLYGLLEESMTL